MHTFLRMHQRKNRDDRAAFYSIYPTACFIAIANPPCCQGACQCDWIIMDIATALNWSCQLSIIHGQLPYLGFSLEKKRYDPG